MQIEVTPEIIDSRIKEKEASYFEKKVFKKYKNLLYLL